MSFQVKVPSGGCDTPQVYVGYPGGGEDVPTKVLRGFEKICGGGARGRTRTATVALVLSDREVSEWDVGAKSWTVVKGTFKVFVGSSSRDIRLEGTMTV